VHSLEILVGSSKKSSASPKTSHWNLNVVDCWVTLSPLFFWCITRLLRWARCALGFLLSIVGLVVPPLLIHRTISVPYFPLWTLFVEDPILWCFNLFSHQTSLVRHWTYMQNSITLDAFSNALLWEGPYFSSRTIGLACFLSHFFVHL
jgi:hypothetical protein